MKNVIQVPDEKHLIITEGIDYLTTGKKSIWGEGDEDTFKIMKDYNFKGKWLNLAAGDGRYNNRLLTQANEVVATDIDQSALAKLEMVTPEVFRKKLVTKRVNLLARFPFEDREFDGVFCTGTLHLFPEKVLKIIFEEVKRVTEKKIFIDFATDIRRTMPDGRQHKKENEIGYTIEKAENIFRENFANFKLQITRHEVPPETVDIGDLHYIFSCNYILIRGERLS